jgi:hypothetical protein
LSHRGNAIARIRRLFEQFELSFHKFLVVNPENYDRDKEGYNGWNLTVASGAAKRQSILAALLIAFFFPSMNVLESSLESGKAT